MVPMWGTIALCLGSVFLAHKIREGALSQLPDEKKKDSARDIRVLLTNSICIFGCVAFPVAFTIRQFLTEPRWLAAIIQIATSMILLGIWHVVAKRKLIALDLPEGCHRELVRSHGLYGIGVLFFVVGSFL
jgi:hypothetical protein